MTMMDPFHLKYGNRLTGLLSVAPLLSEIVWVTSTLISLGNNLSCSVNVCSELQPVLRHVNSHRAQFSWLSPLGVSSFVFFFLHHCSSDFSAHVHLGARRDSLASYAVQDGSTEISVYVSQSIFG